ncbi:MAG TPA: hypothetical protein VD788_06510 [Candidatus Polarisedimenticolaceae bacterium]|nr:hypothetical protein [Candidatus Polarisedimenticolaceae bacterium]
MFDRSFVRLMPLALGAALLAPMTGAEDDACRAELAVTLDREEVRDDVKLLHFTVTGACDRGCAAVTYDLVIQQVLPNLQWKSVRRTGRLEVRDGRGSDEVVHTMSRDLRLLGQDAVSVSCEPCAGQQPTARPTHQTINTSPSLKRTPIALPSTR